MKDDWSEQIWDECLRLWKKLASMPDKQIPRHCITDFKNHVARGLGMREMKHGCPFCEEYSRTRFCPLGRCDLSRLPPCYGTPYAGWEARITRDGMHDQRAARCFYTYLKKKRESKR